MKEKIEYKILGCPFLNSMLRPIEENIICLKFIGKKEERIVFELCEDPFREKEVGRKKIITICKETDIIPMELKKGAKYFAYVQKRNVQNHKKIVFLKFI